MQVVLVLNNIRKLKQLGLDLIFYMVFVKFTKPLLMFVYLLDLYSLQLEHLFAKFLVPILSCLTINKFTEKDYFLFGKEIAEQGSSFYMGSLGVDLLFANIPFEEVINFCIESLFDQNDIAEGLNKSEFKELL